MSYCSILLLKRSIHCMKELIGTALCLEISNVLRYLESSSLLHLFTNLEVQFFPGCFTAMWPAILATMYGVGGIPLSYSLLIRFMSTFSCLADKDCFCCAAWALERLWRRNFFLKVLLLTLNFLAASEIRATSWLFEITIASSIGRIFDGVLDDQ